MFEATKIILFLNFVSVLCETDEDFVPPVITTKVLAIWDNATVPFYVNSEHFDHEQTTQILTALSMFAFKTCIKFLPVMAPPTSEEVLVFQNPDAVRRCIVSPIGHSEFGNHIVNLGYDCLKSPQIDMMIMNTLGFPFEHNRINRDNYIEVLQENIEPGAIDLFTKEDTLPMELRFLQYDVNSVMHFDQREYSRNGHRTIIFKDPNIKQNRDGLTATDLKKIEIVYGPECRARDRQEKIELCQSYPGVARKKREVEPSDLRRKREVNEKDLDNKNVKEDNISSNSRIKREINEKDLANKSLRVNPEITVPPTTEVPSFKDLNVDEEVQQIIENAYKITTAALRNAKDKYCNGSQPTEETKSSKVDSMPSSDVLRIVGAVHDYVQSTLDVALKNLTEFCGESDMKLYQRSKWCNTNWGTDPRCPFSYKSTKSGLPRFSTQHRPAVYMSTKNYGANHKVRHYGRSGNDTADIKVESRKKREAENGTALNQSGSSNQKENEEVTNKTDGQEFVEGKTELKGNQDSEGTNHEENPPSSKTDRSSIKLRKSLYYRHDKGPKSEKENVMRPPKKTKHYSQEIRRPVKDERVRKPEKKRERDILREAVYDSDVYSGSEGESDIKPKKQRDGEYEKERDEYEKERDTITKRPRDDDYETERDMKPKRDKYMESKRPREREQRKKPKEPIYSDQEDVEDRQRPMDIINEWKEETRTTKERKQNKIYSIELVKEDDEIKKSNHHSSEKDKSREVPKTVKLSKANLEFYKERMWPELTVWFMIQEDTTYDTNAMRRRIEEVNDILKKRTCVKLVEITPRQANKYEDYLVIDNSPDYVTGRVGGKQNFGSIELFRGDQHRQHTAMMVMAMLGFYFEVSRHDRDQYIRVHMRHVRPDKLHHFELIRSDATLPVPYDYASATHPAWQFWRQLGHTGISTVATFKENDPDGSVMKSLGQNEELLSETDILKINSVYGVKCFKKRSKSLRMANGTFA